MPSVNRAVTRKAVGPSRRQVSRTYTAPAPVAGLNAVDSIAAMKPDEALVLDNWFPNTTQVSLRNGSASFVTGFGAWVESLMPYASQAGEFLFAVSGTSVYNATTAGAVGAAVVTGLTNARWESINYATSGGQFLYAGNGVDAPLYYDGTTWVKVTGVSTPAITGVTTTKLRNPTVWKNRIWWVEEGSMRAWYLPTSSVGGAASSFDFGPIMELGGKLQSIVTASLSDGSTLDDYIAFLTTEGELALYRGTDPSTPGLFAIVGRYRLGPPVGRRCYFRYGTDTILITSDGITSMTKMIAIGRRDTSEEISYKIQDSINNDITTYKGNFGWQGVVFPLGNKLLINVPLTENSRQSQYVMNTISSAWCTFGRMNSPWNAACFCVLGNNLYYGGATAVYLADTGQSDSGSNIYGTLKTAFSYFKTDYKKFVTMVRPIILSDGTINAVVSLNVDFNDVPSTNAPTFSTGTGAVWNVASWNTSSWALGQTANTNWLTVTGVGFAISLYITAQTNVSQVNLTSIDYAYQSGGLL